MTDRRWVGRRRRIHGRGGSLGRHSVGLKWTALILFDDFVESSDLRWIAFWAPHAGSSGG